MEEKKAKFVVYNDDFFGNGGRKTLGYVNTLAEAQELLISKWKEHGDCKKEVDEILSHTEDELVGREELTLYGSNCYFNEGIAKVEGYVEEESKVAHEVTLGEILKHELANVGDREWRMEIREKDEKAFLQIAGQDKVPLSAKYEHIMGLPTHHVDDCYVYSGMGELTINGLTFPGVDWDLISAEEVDVMLKKHFHSCRKFYSEEEAVGSLPKELVLVKSGHRTITIAPYDKYGYHIEHISAYCEPCVNGQGVFIHIKR